MEPTDFQGPADAAFAPVDPPVFFSLPPMMLAGLILLLAVVALLAWFARDWTTPAANDPCDDIYDRVRKATEAAVKARRDEVVPAARKLVETVDARLGGVLGLAAGLGGPVKKLKGLLDGKRPEGHGAGHGGGHGHGHDDAHGGHAPATPAGPVFVNTGSMVVHAGGGDAHVHDEHKDEHKPDDKPHGGGHGGAHDKGHDKHKDEPLDHKTQVDLLRAEVHAFADHWADKSARLAELRRARADLTRAVPESKQGWTFDKGR